MILDRTAFSIKVNDNSGDIQTVPYNKWLAIDPVPVTNYSEAGENTETKNDNDIITLGKTLDDGSAEYVFIIPKETTDNRDNPSNIVGKTGTGNEEIVSKEFEPDAVMNETENTDNKTVNTIRVLIKDNQSRTQNAIDIKPKQNIGINDIIGMLKNSNFTIIAPNNAEAIKAEAEKMKVNNIEQPNDENNVIDIINSIKGDVKQPENGQEIKDSFAIQYVSPAINESMTAVKLVRNAVFESNKNAYLVSMTCWGDGTRINPTKFLEESVKSVVHDATSYSDIANAAKKDNNLNILPLTESVTYQVPMPYNRYAILTNGNPLYEAVAVITIDATPDHNITSSKFIGVTRIVK